MENAKTSSKFIDTTGKIKPSDWQTHFRELLNPPPPIDHADLDDSLHQLRQDVDDSDLNKIITDFEVGRSIQTLNSNKTPGPDGICVELFKNMVEYVLQFLTTLFNNIFTSGIVPESWGYSIVALYLKKVQQQIRTILEVYP